MKLGEILRHPFRREKKPGDDAELRLGPNGRYRCFFPHAGIPDKGDEIHGNNGYDLANAFITGVISSGDVLEMTTKNDPRNPTDTILRLIYFEPSNPSLGGLSGKNKFLPLESHPESPLIILKKISSWKKLGKITFDQLQVAIINAYGIEGALEYATVIDGYEEFLSRKN